MNLTEDQFDIIEKLAGCNYMPEQVALYLGVNNAEFLREFHDGSSKVRHHYDRGILVAQADSDMKILESSKKGNITAKQQWNSDRRRKDIDILKQKILLGKELDEISRIQALMGSGKCELMSPEELEKYQMMCLVYSLHTKYENEKFIINTLTKPPYGLSRFLAKQTYADALNYFYADVDIPKKILRRISAEKYDNAAQICLAMNDMDNYRKFMESSDRLRGLYEEDREEKPEGYYERLPIYYEKDSKFLNAYQADRRALGQWIDNLDDVSIVEKERLHNEGMTDKATGNPLGLPLNSVPFLKGGFDGEV